MSPREGIQLWSFVRGFTAKASLCTVVLGLVGCGEEDPGSADLRVLSVSVDTVADVVHVRNEGDPPRWSLVEVLTLGGAVGGTGTPRPDEFGFITSVIADTAGLIYVADAQATEVRAFDETGRLVRPIGRRGSGPGEFLALMSIGWLGDLLAVLDPGNARLGLLSKSGDWVEQRFAMAMDGVHLRSAGGEGLYMPVVRADPGGWRLGYVHQLPTGPGDTLMFPPVVPVRELSVRCTYMAGQRMGMRQASFAPELLHVPAPGLMWAETWSSDYRIAFTTAAGDTLRVLERDVPRRSPTNAEWEQETAAFEDFLSDHPDAECDRRSLPRPDAVRLFRSLFFDGEGRLWIERISEDGFILDAFALDGHLLGQVSIPERSERVPPFVSRDRLYLVVADELDVQSVKVFRIVDDNGGP